MGVTTNNLITILVAIPMSAAILTIPLRGRILVQRTLGVFALLALTLFAAWFTLTLPPDTNLILSRMGAWELPFGIATAIDGISGPMLLVTALVSLACFVASWSIIEPRLERGWFHPLFHFLVMGLNFSFLTADLFNLFVAFEIMLMASYALLGLGATRAQLGQAYKYLALNLIASTVFVLAAGLMYGLVGTLNLADLARIVHESRTGGAPLPVGFEPVAVLLIFVFATKAAVFPLWFWLPDVYPTLTGPVAAMFGALLSKVGVYAVIRTYPLILSGATGSAASPLELILPIAAGATMILAVLGAIGSTSLRRLLAFVLMSHVGYLLFGIAIGTQASLAGTLIYMTQEMLIMAGLLICVGAIESIAGTDDLRGLGGLAQRAPMLSTIVFVLLIALASLPPMAGFVGKALIVREGFTSHRWILTALVLTTAVLTLLAALRVWCHGFWMTPRGPGLTTPHGATIGARPRISSALAGASIAAIGALVFSFGAPATVPMAMRATLNLVEPQRFIDATLGAQPPAQAEAMRLRTSTFSEATP